jgi:hypothetical protein
MLRNWTGRLAVGALDAKKEAAQMRRLASGICIPFASYQLTSFSAVAEIL